MLHITALNNTIIDGFIAPPRTGRTHQLRIDSLAFGYPISKNLTYSYR